MPVKGTFREINFSPSTTNVLDCVGRTDLYTVNRRPVWICLNWKGDELSEQEWHDLRERWLLPHREAITKLLGAPEPVAARPTTPAPARQSPPARSKTPAARRGPADEVYRAADRLPLLAGGA